MPKRRNSYLTPEVLSESDEEENGTSSSRTVKERHHKRTKTNPAVKAILPNSPVIYIEDGDNNSEAHNGSEVSVRRNEHSQSSHIEQSEQNEQSDFYFSEDEEPADETDDDQDIGQGYEDYHQLIQAIPVRQGRRQNANGVLVPAPRRAARGLKIDDEYIFNFGMHAGRSFADVYKTHRGYIDWLQREKVGEGRPELQAAMATVEAHQQHMLTHMDHFRIPQLNYQTSCRDEWGEEQWITVNDARFWMGLTDAQLRGAHLERFGTRSDRYWLWQVKALAQYLDIRHKGSTPAANARAFISKNRRRTEQVWHGMGLGIFDC